MLDILILLCTINVLDSNHLVSANGKNYNLNANSVKILRVCINNIFDDSGFDMYDMYHNIFNKIERLFSFNITEFQEKILFRSYIFAFLTDFSLISNYGAFFDALLSNASRYNNGQLDITHSANENIEPDEIICTIFSLYDRVYTHIINNLF